MKMFYNMLRLDSLITIRSGFHYVIIAIGIIFIVLVNFALPSQLNVIPEEVFYDGTENRVFTEFIKVSGEEAVIYDDYEEFRQEIDSRRGSAGIAVTGTAEDLNFELISRNTISDKTLNILKAAFDYTAAAIAGMQFEDSISIEYLREKSPAVPFNLNMIPIFLTFEVVMLGFILIAVMAFQEKEERSIRAYRVSAGGTAKYIMSKATIITMFGLLYGVISVLLTAGTGVDYLGLIIIIVLSSFFMSFLGLFLSVFFRNISEFIIVSITALVILQLPTVSYFNPAFSPAFLRWMPSYPILFGVKEALFASGRSDYLIPLVITLLIESAIIFALCYWGVKIKIMRSGGRV
jgi:ABC-2 type transport system permease protein/fluoroquinolone transport system permease protein